jgi:hypothetical protein
MILNTRKEFEMNTIVTSEYAQKAQTVLWEKLQVAAPIVGFGDAPIVPWEDEKWTLERISKIDLEFTIQLPIIKTKIMRNIAVLEKAGVEYDCILIAHEKERILPFRIGEEVVNVVKRVVVPLAVATAALAVILAGALALLFAAGAAIVMSSALFFLMHDPVVILVLKDGSWLEIGRWDS